MKKMNEQEQIEQCRSSFLLSILASITPRKASKAISTCLFRLTDKLLPKAVEQTAGTETKVLAVTVLTHFSENYCAENFHLSLGETVRYFAKMAISNGCHGVVLPGTMLRWIYDLSTIRCVPGIRPTWYKDDRHEEEIEPKVAVEKGADILVCGSPIMKSQDKCEALKAILLEMSIK